MLRELDWERLAVMAIPAHIARKTAVSLDLASAVMA